MPREFARAYVLRASIVWLAVRAFVAGFGQAPWSLQALVMAAAGTMAIVLIDAEARHERRYLANLGTVHAHRWLSDPARPRPLEDLQAAIDGISSAIALNPDAHFGREYVQLRLLETLRWSRDTPPASYQEVLDRLGTVADGEDAKTTIDGYIGLIVLGQARHSVDVHATLVSMLRAEGHASLAFVARQRLNAILIDGGRSVMMPDADPHEILRMTDLFFVPISQFDELYRYYQAGEQSATAYQQERALYMTAAFDRGEHPDTHPKFWSSFNGRLDIPAAPSGMWLVGGGGPEAGLKLAAISFATGIVGAIGLFVLVKLLRRWSRGAA